MNFLISPEGELQIAVIFENPDFLFKTTLVRHVPVRRGLPCWLYSRRTTFSDPPCRFQRSQVTSSYPTVSHFICEACKVRVELCRELHRSVPDLCLLMLERMHMIHCLSFWTKGTETKSDPTIIADVVLPFSTMLGLSPGKWALQLLSFESAIFGKLFSTRRTPVWTSHHFRHQFDIPLLKQMHHKGERTLQSFSN